MKVHDLLALALQWPFRYPQYGKTCAHCNMSPIYGRCYEQPIDDDVVPDSGDDDDEEGEQPVSHFICGLCVLDLPQATAAKYTAAKYTVEPPSHAHQVPICILYAELGLLNLAQISVLMRTVNLWFWLVVGALLQMCDRHDCKETEESCLPYY